LLSSSTNDGVAMKEYLTGCNFDVTDSMHLKEVTSADQIVKKFAELSEIVKDNASKDIKTAIYVYYSGHGLLVDGSTYGITVNGDRFPLEKKARDLSTRANSLVMGFFDCCRQIPPIVEKGPTVLEKTSGQLHIIHAVGPGKSATSRPDVNGLSEVTKDFLLVMQKSTLTFPASILTWAKYHKTVETVDKMKWQFPLGAKAALPPKEGVALPTTPFPKWEPFEIAEWLSTLSLRENYTASVTGQQIDGSSMQTILEEDAWADFGFSVKTDVLKIKGAIKKLIS